jgi:hypothetical protein
MNRELRVTVARARSLPALVLALTMPAPTDGRRIRAMPRSRSKRLTIALLAILCLLLQQAALAAYLCPIDTGRLAVTTMMGDCAAMHQSHEVNDAGLCVKHCHPERASAADAARLAVPPLALPPVVFPVTTIQSATRAIRSGEVAIARSDPPPRLQYCSLLI